MKMKTAVRKAKAPPERSDWPLVLRLRPALDLTEDQFFALCQLNRDLRLERTAEGELLIMPPTGWEAGHRNFEISRQLANWAMADGTGYGCDSSTGFRLPNGAVRAPDAAWLPNERLASFSAHERERFLPVCPDFVLELWSPTDRLCDVQDKMKEYLANGARLGWLLYPPERRVYVYRPGVPVEQRDNPATLSGDPVLPGFVLDLRQIW
ncbi:MAG TPA: Uma2 family endonuclease [Chloroflexota bacterium]|nr:Uma2 family endonuclease [Chloroflexota bacterium]